MNNLSSRPQAATVTAAWSTRRAQLVDLFGGSGFPKVGHDGRVTITLGSRDFFWLQVSAAGTDPRLMAIVHKGASIVPRSSSSHGLDAATSAGTTARAGPPRLRKRVGGFRFEDPAGEVGIEVMIVRRRPGPHAGGLPGAPHLSGRPAGGRRARPRRHDGAQRPRHPLGLRRPARPGLRRRTRRPILQGRAEPTRPRPRREQRPSRVGRPDRSLTIGSLASSTVLTGEQSNTSIICRMVDASGGPAEPLIVKVFRIVHDGENPDVVVQSALTEAGSTQVPPPATSRRLGRPVRRASSGPPRLRPGVHPRRRGRLAGGPRRAAPTGTDFTARARELGAVTAEIHSASRDPRDGRSLRRGPRGRSAIHARRGTPLPLPPCQRWPPTSPTSPPRSTTSLPGLAATCSGSTATTTSARCCDVPSGWVALDFEGEPLRPLAERVRPDLAPRDVAGMLRSFDYVGGSVRLSGELHDRPPGTGWARLSAAFLEGYAGLSPDLDAGDRPLVRVLELDKALYEVIYEVRNRPSLAADPARGRWADPLRERLVR